MQKLSQDKLKILSQSNNKAPNDIALTIDGYRVNGKSHYRFLVKLLSKVLCFILNMISWKREVIIANLQETNICPADQFNQAIKDIYYNLSYEVSSLIFGYLSYPVKIDYNTAKEFYEMKNQGGIMLAAHYGNFELKGYIMRFLGIEFIATYLPLKNNIADRFLKYLRNRDEVFANDFKGDLASITKIIKDKKTFTFINDQNYRKRNPIKGKFFDSELELSPLAKTIWKRTKCKVWFVWMERKENYYQLYMQRLEPKNDADLSDTSTSFEALYIKAMSEAIVKNKWQYFGWSHRLFYSNKKAIYQK